jgi:predicted Zn-dependent protease with MMP-like domain
MEPEAFEDVVARVVESLPDEFAPALENLELAIEDESPEGRNVFGVYQGVPLTSPGDRAGLLPDRIVIYRHPLERAFRDPAELERQIRVTVLHELAHRLGIDEDRLAELGYG